MREIKFRLRYAEAIVGYEKWYPGSYDGDFCFAKPQWLYSEDGEYWNPEYISHRQKDTFTGLLDKNGKELYEGDVVRDCSNSDFVFEVKWNVDLVGYYMPLEYDPENYCSLGDPDLEIIGNIYSNPELLTK